MSVEAGQPTPAPARSAGIRFRLSQLQPRWPNEHRPDRKASAEHAAARWDTVSNVSGGHEDQRHPTLVGRWAHASDRPLLSDIEAVPFGHDSAMLPGEIEFTETRFKASKAPNQGFTVWDVGSYRVEGDELVIGLANDDTAAYPLEIGEEAFTVTDRMGTKTTYHRIR